ncbi:glycosyltransferase [Pseudohaliea sp.]|uniref:glycosyltransferase n=1 Tax=Pseudohaliea sp. TaxID=2740289 RepID=UPI0032EF8625
MAEKMLRLVLFSSLFPTSARPQAGLFIRERLRQVMPRVQATVVSPQPWFPFQGLLRLVRPGYRPSVPRREVQDDLIVYSPRFLALPGLGRRFDGFMMALSAYGTVSRIARECGVDLLDAHFAYPDGYGASYLARWLSIPFVVTLRGTEVRCCGTPALRKRLLRALNRAASVITVANSLRDVVSAAGADPAKIERIGNGVDCERFQPVDRKEARRRLDLPVGVPVLISVGGLVARKGFHRVIEILPALRERWPELRYLVVGGPGPEGDMRDQLAQQVAALGLTDCVHFLGAIPPEELRVPLSASDLFVLATENEGWANVFLEAMACGLPVVTTRVGGNAEVVESEALGRLVPFGDGEALREAIEQLLQSPPDSSAIREYAVANAWSRRVDQLLSVYRRASEGGQ